MTVGSAALYGDDESAAAEDSGDSDDAGSLVSGSVVGDSELGDEEDGTVDVGGHGVVNGVGVSAPVPGEETQADGADGEDALTDGVPPPLPGGCEGGPDGGWDGWEGPESGPEGGPVGRPEDGGSTLTSSSSRRGFPAACPKLCRFLAL